MAETYRLTTSKRLINGLVGFRTRLGWGPGTTYVLTVKGRKSGQMHPTPVTLVKDGNQRWLVAPYGEVNWVRNARAAKQATLARGGRDEQVSLVELGPEESAPVLKKYITNVPITRPYFDATQESPLSAFVSEAPRHPVFRIIQEP